MKIKTRLVKLGNSTPLSISLLLILHFAVYSQTADPIKIKVGDTMIVGSFIKPYKNLWQMTFSRTGQDPIIAGTWSDEVVVIHLSGRSLLKRTQIANYPKRGITLTTINVFDPLTMAPISREFSRNDGTFNHIDFAGASIKYRRVELPGGAAKEGEAHFDSPVFDFFGGLYGLLVTAFPLKAGFAASLPSLDENTDSVRWAIFRVVREEMVEAGPDRKIKAWVVETDDNGPMTFWLTKEAPYVIKLVYVGPQGTWTYTMV